MRSLSPRTDILTRQVRQKAVSVFERTCGLFEGVNREKQKMVHGGSGDLAGASGAFDRM
jgi:hypothetical protein